jgi:hypothetical protein
MKVMQHLAQQRFRLLGDFGDEELLDRHAVVLPHPKPPAKLAFKPGEAWQGPRKGAFQAPPGGYKPPLLEAKRTARDEKGARALKSELSRLLHLWRCSSSQPAKEPQGLVKWLERQGKSRKVYDSTRQPIACVVVSKSF